MRTLAFSLALWSVTASVARADAITPFEGDCPPGLVVEISGHAEVCAPRACSTDVQCGARAACREIGECWAPREVSPSGGQIFDDMVMRDVPIGLCGAGGSCAEGRCATRRQCEPTIATDAWDPAARRWTAEPYHAPLLSCAAAVHRRPFPLALLAIIGALLGTAWRHRSRQG
jgi:hypothetical protein